MLVAAAQGGTTTRYVQDLVAPLSQVLQTSQDSSTTSYVDGHERLVALSGITQTGYGHDALGSVRQTLSDTGQPLTALHDDPWGVPQGSATPPTFGFTGELQEPGGLVDLRARWYHPGIGTFPTRDPYPGVAPVPASLHPYQYAHANPVTWTDPTGTCLGWLWGDPDCQFAGADYRSYDYAGAGQVIVTGLGGAATVVACAGTAGAACVAGAAGAAAVTSWGQQALTNAGRPVWQAATGVSWRRVGVDAAVGGVSGPLGAGTGRLAGRWTGRIPAALLRRMANGSIVGGVSGGSGRVLSNLLDGDSRTGWVDGVFEACLTDALFGALVAGLGYRWEVFVSRPRVVNPHPPRHDPLARYGPARITHPAEYEQVLRELQEAGVEIDFRSGEMAYSAQKAGPGRMVFDPDGSIGALRHEMQHFRDMREAGYPGLGPYVEDYQLFVELECRAYQQEIDYALSIGDKQTARELQKLMMARIREIENIYGGLE